MHVCLVPPGIFLLTCWRECDKWPLVITKWIELCDGHIRRPQEKCHANYIIWFSSVIMGDECVLFVHPPSPHPSWEHCLPKLRPRRRGSTVDGGIDRREQEEGKKGWVGEKKTRWLCALLRARECPQVVEFLVLFAHSETPKKWNVCCDREIDSGKVRCKHRVA